MSFQIKTDSRDLMLQLARLAGIPEGGFRKMVLVLEIYSSPILYTEGFIRQPVETLNDQLTLAHPLQHEDTPVVVRMGSEGLEVVKGSPPIHTSEIRKRLKDQPLIDPNVVQKIMDTPVTVKMTLDGLEVVKPVQQEITDATSLSDGPWVMKKAREPGS